MKRFLIWIIIITCFTVFSSSRETRNVGIRELAQVVTNNPFNLYSPWVDSVFNSLTLDQHIGQLFFAPAYSNLSKNHENTINSLINKHQIGGLIFFQGGPRRQALLTNRYQALSKTPLLIAIDAEWGLGMRLDSCVSFPRQMALGAIQDMNLIYRMGEEIAQQCHRMGIHINFAPVVDINNNPLNPVIGLRSFGENSEEVTKRSIMYMSGLQDKRILTSAKHFPGHGNTSVDSHYALPIVTDTYNSLNKQEWYPYMEMMKKNLTGVMVAHVHVPELDDTPNLPASLSRRVMTDILRDSLNFNGLIFTDALNMQGVTDHFKGGEISVRALEAGADVLLMPADIPSAIAAVKVAVETGRIDRQQIEISCRRILAAKEWTGLNNYTPINTRDLNANLNSPETDLLHRQLVEASLTIVQNQENILPLSSLEKEKTAILITGTAQSNLFLRTLRLYEENNFYFIDKSTTKQRENEIFAKLKTYSRVIVGIHNTSSTPTPAGNYGISPNVSAFVDRLSESTKVILCVFAPPYALSTFNNKEKLSAIVVSYQGTTLAMNYTAQLIYGAIAGKGVLPVSIDSVYTQGMGVKTAGMLRLKYSIPEEVQMLSHNLLSIDTMVRNAIRAGAIPGCQILAARNGIVFFNKEYGKTRYDDLGKTVTPEHIYDLASVSKIAATVPATMMFYDLGQLKMRGRLGEYLPEMRGSDKENITMIDLLTHQSRLRAHIAFYLQTMEPLDENLKLLSPTNTPPFTIYLGPKTYLNSERRFKDGYYSNLKDDKFRLQVANDMFVINSYTDTIFNAIRDSRLLPRKQYTYSDLGFILLANIVERFSKQTIDQFVSQNFYKSLGASTLGYLPKNRFAKDRIVPTSNDTVFRKQWLQGRVHDENAALMGGVAGHAGLFGNANDVAKLMQMFLNMGTYGGKRYIKETTLAEFTKSPFAKEKNHRGLGFDKPALSPKPTDRMGNNASPNSYGHTGFTGTMVWMDPENGLLFVFLSNRVHPDATNNKLSSTALRARIYEVLANAIE